MGLRGEWSVGVVRRRVGLAGWCSRSAVVLAGVALAATLGCQMRAQKAPAPLVLQDVPDATPAQMAALRDEAKKGETAHPLTKDQAKDLFKRVDAILSFVSTDTKLPIVHSVK